MLKTLKKNDFKRNISTWKFSLQGDTDQMFDAVQNKIDQIQPEPYPLHIKYIW